MVSAERLAGEVTAEPMQKVFLMFNVVSESAAIDVDLRLMVNECFSRETRQLDESVVLLKRLMSFSEIVQCHGEAWMLQQRF
jgi:hypothetical protein